MALLFLGYGVFVMVQRQMQGIRTRAERLARDLGPVPYPAVMPAVNGQAGEMPDAILATAGPA